MEIDLEEVELLWKLEDSASPICDLGGRREENVKNPWPLKGLLKLGKDFELSAR